MVVMPVRNQQSRSGVIRGGSVRHEQVRRQSDKLADADIQEVTGMSTQLRCFKNFRVRRDSFENRTPQVVQLGAESLLPLGEVLAFAELHPRWVQRPIGVQEVNE